MKRFVAYASSIAILMTSVCFQNTITFDSTVYAADQEYNGDPIETTENGKGLYGIVEGKYVPLTCKEKPVYDFSYGDNIGVSSGYNPYYGDSDLKTQSGATLEQIASSGEWNSQTWYYKLVPSPIPGIDKRNYRVINRTQTSTSYVYTYNGLPYDGKRYIIDEDNTYLDGVLDIDDVILLQKYLLTESQISKVAATNYDFDSNGIINASDLSILKNKILSKNSITKDVTFIDYDGTVLYEYDATEFLNMSELPKPLDHTSLNDGLGKGSWNTNLVGAKSIIKNNGKYIFGSCPEPLVPEIIESIEPDAEYAKHCATIFFDDIKQDVELSFMPLYSEIDASRYTPKFYVDWGDGTTDTYPMKQTNTQVYITINHTYQEPGDYAVTLCGYHPITQSSASKITFIKIGDIPSEEQVPKPPENFDVTTTPVSKIKDSDGIYIHEKISKVYLSDMVYVSKSSNWLLSYPNMKYISSRMYNLGVGASCLGFGEKLEAFVAYNYCYYVSNSESRIFNNCKNLKVFSIATDDYGGGSQGTACFFPNNENQTSLKQIYFPPGLIQYNNCCSYMKSLKEIVFTSTPDSKGLTISNSFRYCTALESIRFTKADTKNGLLTITDSFKNLPKTCKIYVPKSAINDYKEVKGMPDPDVYEYIGY